MEKQLTPSQIELLRLKRQLLENMIRQAQDDWQRTLNLIAKELGIPEEEFSQWRLEGDKFVKNEPGAKTSGDMI
jgi:DNA-directed RNA polymerase specialized sigma subunit